MPSPVFQEVIAGTTTGGTSVSVDFDDFTEINAGDDLLFFTGIDRDDATGCSASGFSVLEDTFGDSGSQAAHGAVLHKVADGTESGSISISFGNGANDGASAFMLRYSGGDGVTVPLSSSNAAGRVTNPASGGLTLTPAGDWTVISFYVHDTPSNSYSASPAGMINRHNAGSDSTGVAVGASDLTVNSDGTAVEGDDAWTLTIARNAIAFSVAIKGVAGDVTGTAEDTPQINRPSGDGSPAPGAVSKTAAVTVQLSRSAGDGSAIVVNGDVTGAAVNTPQQGRQALDGQAQPGATQRTATPTGRALTATAASAAPGPSVGFSVASLQNRRITGFSGFTTGTLTKSSSLAQITRPAAPGLAIPGAASRQAVSITFSRQTVGFASAGMGAVVHSIIAQYTRASSTGSSISGSASRVASSASISRSAGAGSSSQGATQRTATPAQIRRITLVNSAAIPGAVSIEAERASFARTVPAFSGHTPGASSTQAQLAKIYRTAFVLELLPGLSGLATSSATRRQVLGHASATVGAVTRAGIITQIQREALVASYLAGSISEAGLLAQLARLVPGFSSGFVDAGAQGLIGSLSRQVPGFSSAAGGEVAKASVIALRQLSALVASYINGAISLPGLLAQLARTVPGFASPFMGSPIMPADVFTHLVQRRASTMIVKPRSNELQVIRRASVMSVSAKKVEDILFEREQTVASKNPWTMDFTQRLAEYGASAITGLTVTCDEGANITIADATIAGLKVAANVGPATEEGDYHIRFNIEFDAAPNIDEAVMLLRVRNVPIN